MDRKTALATAGAMVATSAAAVSALFLTIGSPAQTSTSEPAPAVRTQYQVVTIDAPSTTVAGLANEVVVYEIDYVQADPVGANSTYDGDDDYYDDDDYDDDDYSGDDYSGDDYSDDDYDDD